VVFTPPSGRAVCIEPYTVLPGAGGFEADRGWRVLETGESLTASMTIQPRPGPAG
jgi:galactose mutarotase-like enzyme